MMANDATTEMINLEDRSSELSDRSIMGSVGNVERINTIDRLESAIIKFQKKLISLIPIFIAVIFALMVCGCLYLAPEHYRDKKIFQISNLGNWQEGIGIFSFSLCIIGGLVAVMVDAEYQKRKAYYLPHLKIGKRKYGKCFWFLFKVSFLFSGFLLMCGLILTGCFQQSYNKPGHQIGVMLMSVSCFLLFLSDIIFHCFVCYCCPLDVFKFQKVRTVLKIVFALSTIIFGVAFFVFHCKSLKDWKNGKDAAIEKLIENGTLPQNATECPNMQPDGRKADYYPCKSKTLWEETDPGWNNYATSGYCEFVFFISFILFSWTFMSFNEISCRKQEDDQDLVREDSEMDIEKRIMRYKKHFISCIPFLLILIFIVMILSCLQLAPQHYKDKPIFQLSNLGNWQPSLGPFALSMCISGLLVSTMIKHEFMKREVNWKESIEKQNRVCWFILKFCFLSGGYLMMLGMFFTGCFQQSYNKPVHKTGVIAMCIASFLSFYSDIAMHICVWHKDAHGDDATFSSIKKIKTVSKIVIALFSLGSGSAMCHFYLKAHSEWDAGADAALEALVQKNTLDTPKCVLIKPYEPRALYYPCKSKTLWNVGDPGWEEYEISSYMEIIFFTSFIIYLLTFLSNVLCRNKNDYEKLNKI